MMDKIFPVTGAPLETPAPSSNSKFKENADIADSIHVSK